MNEKELREAFDGWFRDTPLTVGCVFPDGTGYTKESLEWAFQEGHALAAKAAIKASGAEHLQELVEALERMRRENSDPYGIAKEALRKLPEHMKARG